MNKERLNIPVYVVSLPRDTDRRAHLRERFVEGYDQFTFVEAVDALNASNEGANKCHNNRRKPLTVSEKGCSLSHMKVWRRFLSSDAPACIIFEDDVIGDDALLRDAMRLMNVIPDDSFMLLGAQRGLRNHRFVYGVPKVCNDIQFWELQAINWRFLASTCCYGITRIAARNFLRHQEACLDRADNWRRLLRGISRTYIADLFQHPVSSTDSHLERERELFSRQPLARRVWADGVTYTSTTALIKIFWPILAKAKRLQCVSSHHVSSLDAKLDC